VGVTGYNFEEQALQRMRERAESPFGYVRDLQLDLVASVTALDAVLAVHEPSRLEYSPGYVCAVCFDKPWPCPTRAAVRGALLAMPSSAGNGQAGT
jgi:hypothetical protein